MFNIQQLTVIECLELLSELEEKLGLVSPKNYQKIMGKKRSTLYKAMKEGRILSIKIDGVNFIIINDK